MTVNFDDLIKNQEETQYNIPRSTTRTQRDKLRALRDEFGFQKTEPKKEADDSVNVDETE
jgi:hypothetical protein